MPAHRCDHPAAPDNGMDLRRCAARCRGYKGPFIVTAVCNWGIRTLGDLISIPLICRNIPRPVTEELFRSNPDILPTISFALAFTVILMCADDIARWIWIGLRFRKGHWRKGLTEG